MKELVKYGFVYGISHEEAKEMQAVLLVNNITTYIEYSLSNDEWAIGLQPNLFYQ